MASVVEPFHLAKNDSLEFSNSRISIPSTMLVVSIGVLSGYLVEHTFRCGVVALDAVNLTSREQKKSSTSTSTE